MLTITLSGPQGCGKTRMSRLIRSAIYADPANGHFNSVQVIDGEEVKIKKGATCVIRCIQEQPGEVFGPSPLLAYVKSLKIKELEERTNPPFIYTGKIDLTPSAVNQLFQTHKIWVKLTPTNNGWLYYIRRINGKGHLYSRHYKRKIDAVNAAKSLARQLNIEYRGAK